MVHYHLSGGLAAEVRPGYTDNDETGRRCMQNVQEGSEVHVYREQEGRNAFQEFQGPKFVGSEADRAGCPRSLPDPPQGTDSFGAATAAGAWFLPRMLPTRASPVSAASLSGQHWVITGSCCRLLGRTSAIKTCKLSAGMV